MDEAPRRTSAVADITFGVTGVTGDFENVRGEIHEFSNNDQEIYHLLPLREGEPGWTVRS